ncbi:MAG: PQQ-dependent sugar dehydrogenase [Gemmataceae bacterium]|nr:PQQ-dependent sugar dehydrogenase [Gemmataceae bacterium]
MRSKSVLRTWGGGALAGVTVLTVGLTAWRSAAPAGDKGRLAAPPPTAYECRFTEGPIVIDGRADEAAWKHAQIIDQFYLPWLGKDARRARTATTARLLWDREYLYFCADMEDADLYADVLEHDGMTWENDVFELFLKPADDKPGYYEFQVNAAGTIMDLFLPRRGAGGYQRFIKDGDFHIDAKVRLRGTLNKWHDRDEGWSVEGRIPWSDLLRTGGRPEPGERWKFALCRYDYSVDFEGPELSTCAPLKSKSYPDFHLFEDYATLTFIGPDKSPSGRAPAIERRVPLTTSNVVGFPDPPPPFRTRKVFTQATIDFPLWIEPIPGTDELLLIANESNSGNIVLYSFKDDPDVKDVHRLLALPETGYHFAFHPRFRDNGYIFIGSNGRNSSGQGPRQCRIVRYTMTARPRSGGDGRGPRFAIDPKSAKTIIEWESDGHNGAALTFGHDGMLYVTTGDGTSDSDTLVVGQDMTSLLAKILRIDVDRPDPGKAYSVPKDNPFLNMKEARPEIWALGLRNPWRITTDAKTGHIWVAQNGQDLYEQAFLVRKGDNYGWSVMEGSNPFYLQRPRGPNFYTRPTVEHHHSEARSLTGGIVYYGTRHSELVGAYIYGDYATGKIWAVKPDGTKVTWHKEIAETRFAITGFGTDSRGEILICDYQGGGKGGLYTLDPAPKDAPPSRFPRKLSDSGLFRSVKGHVMEPGLIPYTVNAVLWSDGAGKQRWLGIPGDGVIEFTTNRGWNFPDETVIVKSFYLDLEEGNPASRRWIETRFLTKQLGQWYGYSYEWNDEQTEGTLVDAKGKDREFTVRTVRGEKKLLWHYPSRSECMVCHSRAANFVLGLTELQFNREHDYGGVRENQLRVLERLGLFRVNYFEETRQRLREALKDQGKSEREIDAYLERQLATRGQREPRTSSLLAAAPEKYRKLVDPYDPKQDLALRARSYLHSNCSQCHVEAGGGNSQMELEFTTPLDKMRVVDVKPVHDTFGLQDARLIAPGHPERSVLLRRISHRDKGHMPPLATRLVDQESVRLLEEWIRSMK